MATRLGVVVVVVVVVVVRGMCDHAEQVKEVVQCFGDLKGFHLLVDPQEVRNQPMNGVLIVTGWFCRAGGQESRCCFPRVRPA